MDFEWDELKAKTNQRKHGVSFEEALSCFFDPEQVAFYDCDHSDNEDREIMIAHSNQGRLVLVVYALRKNTIRLISARRATKREAEDYEKRI